jgi:hypothetical protein
MLRPQPANASSTPTPETRKKQLLPFMLVNCGQFL